MKKLSLFLALLLPLLAAAQEGLQGTWKFHNAFLLSQATDFIDTEQYAYALASGTLMRVDKQAQALEVLTPASGMSDVKASGIHYNYDKRYLLVVYANSNLDFLYDDGRVVNVSDIKDAVMTSLKTINDATFDGDDVLLATAFGLVVIDGSAVPRVKESRNYGAALTSVARVGDRMVISRDDSLYCSDSERERLSDFKSLDIKAAAGKIRPISDTRCFVIATKSFLGCTFTESGCTATSILAATANNVQPTTGGAWLANFRANKYYYVIKDDAKFSKTQTKTADNTALFSRYRDGDGTAWKVNSDGICRVGDETAYKPDGLCQRSATFRLWYSMYNCWDNCFYITTADQKNGDLVGNSNWTKHVFRFDDNTWSDATPTDLRSTSRMGKIAFIPGMANSYFMTDRSYKIYRIINGELDGTFMAGDSVNADLQYGSKPHVAEPALLVDNEGNLWMIACGLATGVEKVVAMLPRDKTLADKVSYSDWVQLDPNLFALSFAQRQSIAESADGVKCYVSGYLGNKLNFWRQKPGTGNAPEYEVYASDEFTDQNGQAVDWYQNEAHVLAADSTGNMWIGGRTGIFYVKADEVFTPGFRATVPVADTDDTPYNIRVTSIAADPFNRKWIGTYEAGLYVVSPDGSQVICHFDELNSDLPSAFIHEVSASTEKAIVVTENGVVEFDMGLVPTVVDYTAVTAAPLFADPGYTGFVTIGQVEPGALVRITDRDGNVVREFTATASQVAWDTCLENGERVPTGVYDIYAGRSTDQLPGTPQARVKVVK